MSETKTAGGEGSPGIKCPKCGCAATKVYYTRQIKNGTRRVRTCFYCKHRFVTRESA